MTTTTDMGRRRRPMWREFLLFIGALYGTCTAGAFAISIWAAFMGQLPLRFSLAASLLFILLFSWIGGYCFARWIRL